MTSFKRFENLPNVIVCHIGCIWIFDNVQLAVRHAIVLCHFSRGGPPQRMQVIVTNIRKVSKKQSLTITCGMPIQIFKHQILFRWIESTTMSDVRIDIFNAFIVCHEACRRHRKQNLASDNVMSSPQVIVLVFI